MKNILITILLTLTIVLLGSCEVQYSADYPHYESAEQMIEKADLIVTAEIDDHDVRDIGEYRYDVYTVQVSHVYKSDESNLENLEIRYMLNEVDELKIGNEYIFFLETYGEAATPMVLNVTQATYELSDGALVNITDSNEGFENVLSLAPDHVLSDLENEASYAPLN